MHQTSGIDEEFQTLDLLLSSNAETRAVDAFALALIKTERQIRKLFTHLIYQYPCFGDSDIPALRQALTNNRHVYFEGFIRGINAIYPRSVELLVGNQYSQMQQHLMEAIEHRNKIFHGQLTPKQLSRSDLEAAISNCRRWCAILAESTLAEIGYDGFARNSFQKSSRINLSARYKLQLHTVAEYEDLIRNSMQR